MRIAEVLREGIDARQIGGDLESHGLNAMGFVAFEGGRQRFAGAVVDLGSGVGLPALPLAMTFGETTWTLIERRHGRAELLVRAVRRLRLSERIEVVAADAADVAWGDLRGSADFVTARSFGSPAETAELGAAFLRAGGDLLTSEPRDSDVGERWPRTGLRRCGLKLAEEWETDGGRYVRLRRTAANIDLPRRGARKIPLF